MKHGNIQILVTGAAGWLGRSLIDNLLTQGYGTEIPMRCLVLPDQAERFLQNFHDPSLRSRLQVVPGDLRENETCHRFCGDSSGSILFHTAGLIHPHRVRDFYDVNVVGTRKLLEAASRHGVGRVVVVSSNSPCGCNPHPDHLFDELSPYAPYMNYGRSKMIMEKTVQEFQSSGKISTVIIRAPWFYGPHQPERQTVFFKMIRHGKLPIVGRGDNLRSMTYIENLAQGLLMAGNAEAAIGKTYWIADARPYTMNEIVDTVENLLESEFRLKVSHKRLRVPGWISDLSQLADYCIQSIGHYSTKIHVLSEMNKTIACSIKKAQTELGYTPRIELREGMRRSIQWCIESGIQI